MDCYIIWMGENTVMLKVAGMLCIVAGMAGFGRYLGAYLKYHLEQLTEGREIFARMDAGREYLRLPYAELLRRTAKGRSRLFYEILTEVADEMEKNREGDVEALWEAAFLRHKKQLLLVGEEQELLLALAKSLTLEGDHTQVARIYFIQLEERIQKAMEEKREKQKLYGTVSLLGGLFLVILLL